MRTAVNSDPDAVARCPGCSVTVSPGRPHCTNCRIWLAGPQAAELWWIDGEIDRVSAARTWLAGRRVALLTELYDQVAERSGETAPDGARVGKAVPEAARGAEPVGRSRSAEVSAPSAARWLVASGAVLVVIAATAFTVVNWGQVGPLARCAILLAVTIPVLAAPRALVRRGLNATAEAVATVVLALTIGNAYLIGQLIGAGHGSAIEAALGTAALAGLWAAYGRIVRLRGPRLAATCLAQLPGVFGAAWLIGVFDVHVALAWPLALVLVLTASVDLMVAEPVAQIAGAVTWTGGILLGCAGLAFATRADLAWLSCVCAMAAFAGLVIAPRGTARWIPVKPVAAISGALLAVALTVPAAFALPRGWELAGIGVASFGVTVAARMLGRDGKAGLVAAGSAAILAVGALVAAPVALLALQPPHPLARFWTAAAIRGGRPIALPAWPATPAVAIVLALAGLAGLLVAGAGAEPAGAEPAAKRATGLAGVGIVLAGLVAAALPAAAGLTGWAALGVLTASAGVLLEASTRIRSGGTAASWCGVVLAAAAVAWSATSPAATISVLAVLTAMFARAAALARRPFPTALNTAGCLVAATGLALAVPLAAGWPARYAAFAVLAMAVAAIGVATRLRQPYPLHALVLDAGAGPVVLVAGLMAAGNADAFGTVAASAALIASTTAWLRTGGRRIVALVGAGYAMLAAVVAQWGAVATALFAPYRLVGQTWRGHEASYIGAAHQPDLPVAVAVLAVCLAAAVTAAGAWRGSGRASLDAVSAVLPLIAVPAGLAAGFGYTLTVGLLLTLALGLTAWAAFGRSLAPAGAALVASSLALAWALAAPAPTLIVLGCLAAGYACAASRARLVAIRVGAACLTVLCGAVLAECAVLAAGGPAWQAGLAVIPLAAAWLGIATLAQARTRSAGGPARVRARAHPVVVAAARSDAGPGPHGADRGAGRDAGRATGLLTGQFTGAVPGYLVGLAAEITAWLALAAGTAQCLGRPGPASLALAATGLTCLAVAIRPTRRPAAWAGLASCEAAWCVWLAAAGVSAPEPYTLPVAAAALALGWRAGRSQRQARSWLTYGPGLALLLLPSLVAVWSGLGWQDIGWQNIGWQSAGWIRPVLLGLAAAAVAVAGARRRLQAPLLAGSAVAVLDAGRELAPAVRHLAGLLPGWVPIAMLGVALLWAGATYEARLRNLNSIRMSLAAMR